MADECPPCLGMSLIAPSVAHIRLAHALPPRYFPKVLYLALGPGLAGHTLINACVSRLQPLEITLALTLEPIVGSLLGLAMEVQRAPSAWTWAGGTVLLASTVLVSVSSSRRKSAGDGVRGAVGYEAVGGGVKDWAASRSARRGTDFVPGLSKASVVGLSMRGSRTTVFGDCYVTLRLTDACRGPREGPRVGRRPMAAMWMRRRRVGWRRSGATWRWARGGASGGWAARDERRMAVPGGRSHLIPSL